MASHGSVVSLVFALTRAVCACAWGVCVTRGNPVALVCAFFDSYLLLPSRAAAFAVLLHLSFFGCGPGFMGIFRRRVPCFRLRRQKLVLMVCSKWDSGRRVCDAGGEFEGEHLTPQVDTWGYAAAALPAQEPWEWGWCSLRRPRLQSLHCVSSDFPRKRVWASAAVPALC